MKRIFIVLLFCLSFFSCTKKEEKIIVKNKPYIISYEDRKFLDDLKKRKIPPPPKGFYGESQLIIDDNGNLYYYQKEYFAEFCDFGREYDTLPHFLGLKPKDIVKIPHRNLNNFLSENILNKEKNRQVLIVASQNDTIKNTSLLDFLNKNKLYNYIIRRTTQEEDTVLHYKKSNKLYYYYDSIQWDKTKIKLLNK